MSSPVTPQETVRSADAHGRLPERTLAGWLSRHGLDLTEAELVASLDAAVPVGRLVSPDVARLPLGDESVLSSHSGVAPAAASELARGRARAVHDAAAMLSKSLSVRELADRLEVAPSTVRHWIRDSTVYALPGAAGRGVRRVPRWQLEDGHLLPGLGQVLRALPADMHPVQLERFFTTTQPELAVDGDAMSPREWLARGGAPEPVATLAAGLDDPVTGRGAHPAAALPPGRSGDVPRVPDETEDVERVPCTGSDEEPTSQAGVELHRHDGSARGDG
ncbi:helix-turn-helix domain-containing protein [Pseudokineococcus basanitobsidens]|uniref:Helix-turn-helix domain-containing protein n=1 Tax=Pseudokineococcus basanitobsidens TaxID=1926649 RepID=A0ABU8RPG0_9ACTN